MGMLHQLEKWSTTHHPRWLVLLRIVLGFSLILKGISFLQDSVSLQILLSQSGFNDSITWLILLITWANFLGGFFIIPGLFTRWAALVNIPILIIAVFWVNLADSAFPFESELGFSLVILLLLIFFLVEGGGPLSLDNYLKKNPK